jgi:predicted nucleotidyltransferase
MAIDPKAVSALKILAQIFAEENRAFVLIGATGPQIVVHLGQGGEFSGRTTRDVDAVVEAADWEDFEGMRQRLFKAGFKPGSAPHELLFGPDVFFDLIPYGSGLVQNDQLEWPGTDRIMSTLGVEEAFEYAERATVAPDLSVRVVPISVLVLLKIISYTDRPEERTRDLSDVVRYFEHYEGGNGEGRRFEIGEVTVEARPVEFEEAGAYLLGIEVARLAKPKSLIAVRTFVKEFSDEYARPILQIMKEEGRILNNESRRTEIFRLFKVFAAGLTEGAKS